MAVEPNLVVTDQDLKRLADDLDAMRSHIDGQVRRMDAIVDRAEARWRSEAATAYRKLHREAGADAVRVREILGVLAKAVRMSRDGFTRQELDVLRQFRAEMKKVDIDAEVRELSGEVPGGSGSGGTAAPASRVNDL
ncbi:WXG100 family type VII secretion target [Streptomyces roseicoloratus]|uniref:WXG100 family type VII secretion target n=1 Tax=Streptomyces roseicoloratus TaxID=2508722 RepID=A0ABY9RPE3_9ACTN|nr:WXG100 family type VII secretion target [Streptomyces roseicoloratus]WMX44065.1 WXG100 family type VII secretion target [Streptomyces roseicoloratus]